MDSPGKVTSQVVGNGQVQPSGMAWAVFWEESYVGKSSHLSPGEAGQVWRRAERHGFSPHWAGVILQDVALKAQPSHLQARHSQQEGTGSEPGVPVGTRSAAGQRTQGQEVQMAH